MAELCLITDGLDCATCDETFQVPGLEEDQIYLFNYSEVATPFTEAVDGEISGLVFDTYKGLFPICIHTNSGMISEELASPDNAGNYYKVSFTARVINSSTATRNAVNAMVGVRLGLIAKRKDGGYLIIGENGGVKMSVNTKTTGDKEGSDNGDLITLTGIQKGKYKKFFLTSDTVTDALITSLLA